jgi:hypothetical protein
MEVLNERYKAYSLPETVIACIKADSSSKVVNLP